MSWIVTALLMVNCFQNPDEAFIYYQTVKVDTISLGDYRGISYYTKLSSLNDITRFALFIEKDNNIILKIAGLDVNIYNFCSNNIDKFNPCYLKDINNDSLPEILIRCYTGGMHCCEDLYVYSLQDQPINLDTVHTDTAYGYLKDIDNDSIPEYIWSDISFDGWKTFGTAFKNSIYVSLPLLIWKWDGHKYRLANFRISESIWDSLNIAEEKVLKIPAPADSNKVGYDPSARYPIFPQPELVSDMLIYIFEGKILESDSLFNANWPKEIPGKEDFYRDFKKQLKSGQYWWQLLESGWK